MFKVITAYQSFRLRNQGTASTGSEINESSHSGTSRNETMQQSACGPVLILDFGKGGIGSDGKAYDNARTLRPRVE